MKNVNLFNENGELNEVVYNLNTDKEALDKLVDFLDAYIKHLCDNNYKFVFEPIYNYGIGLEAGDISIDDVLDLIDYDRQYRDRDVLSVICLYRDVKYIDNSGNKQSVLNNGLIAGVLGNENIFGDKYMTRPFIHSSIQTLCYRDGSMSNLRDFGIVTSITDPVETDRGIRCDVHYLSGNDTSRLPKHVYIWAQAVNE